MSLPDTDDKEIKRLRAKNKNVVEKLVGIYSAYFEVVEFGESRRAALDRVIEDSMDIDMKIILELAKKRGAE